jgi:hypothetical protein
MVRGGRHGRGSGRGPAAALRIDRAAISLAAQPIESLLVDEWLARHSRTGVGTLHGALLGLDQAAEKSDQRAGAARAPFRRQLLPRVVDQHTPHRHGCHGEEMGPVAPVHPTVVHEPQVALVDQRGGGQHVPRSLSRMSTRCAIWRRSSYTSERRGGLGWAGSACYRSDDAREGAGDRRRTWSTPAMASPTPAMTPAQQIISSSTSGAGSCSTFQGR